MFQTTQDNRGGDPPDTTWPRPQRSPTRPQRSGMADHPHDGCMRTSSLQAMAIETSSMSSQTSTVHSHRHGCLTLPPVTQPHRHHASPSNHALPPVTHSQSQPVSRHPRLGESLPAQDVGEAKCVLNGRDLPDRRGSSHVSGCEKNFQEGRYAQEQQVKAARRRELARRHLSQSLQLPGARTVLPGLRRSQSYKAHVMDVLGGGGTGREQAAGQRPTRSLGPRKPARDQEGLRRSRSLREGFTAHCTEDTPSAAASRYGHPLSLSLPHHPTSGGNVVSLATLVHELNATMHYPSSPSRRPLADDNDDDDDDDDDDDTVWPDWERANGLDPDLCPRLTGKDTCSTPNRALTPALRKLDRRKVSSRVRTQQWVNQIEGAERRGERRKKQTDGDSSQRPPLVSLIFEQEI